MPHLTENRKSLELPRFSFPGSSCFRFAGTAQTVPCKVSLSALPAAPELKGFHLGMTMEQAKTHVPQIVFGRTDLLGSSKTTINPGFDPRIDKSRFQDVRSISLDFLDGRLVSLWIGYDSNFKWTGIPEFVAGISQSLSLPNAWIEWKVRGRQMRCADFELTVTTIAQSPSFRIVDTRRRRNTGRAAQCRCRRGRGDGDGTGRSCRD